MQRRSWKKEKTDRQKGKREKNAHTHTQTRLFSLSASAGVAVAVPSTVATSSECLYLACVSLCFGVEFRYVPLSLMLRRDSLRPGLQPAALHFQSVEQAADTNTHHPSPPKTTGVLLIPYGSILMPRPFQYRWLTERYALVGLSC